MSGAEGAPCAKTQGGAAAPGRPSLYPPLVTDVTFLLAFAFNFPMKATIILGEVAACVGIRKRCITISQTLSKKLQGWQIESYVGLSLP